MRPSRQAMPLKRLTGQLLIAVVLVACAALQPADAAAIDMVTVGNAGNAPDTRYVATGIGLVDHVYRIGKYEVTAGQYTEFLNSVAQADPNFLYNTNMAILANKGANIARSGSAPNFSYSVDADWADRPVNIVSFWDAVRFANWLHNGQPTGPQGPDTTEGGAYHNVGNDVAVWTQRRRGSSSPTPTSGIRRPFTTRLSDWPPATSTIPHGRTQLPGNDVTETNNPGNNANHDRVSPQGAPYYRTVVGEYELSASPYGTFDQAGNVKEWSETEVPFPFGSTRELRGGSFYDGFLLNSATLCASDHSFDFPTNHFNNVGFRVAGVAVPEPSAILLLGLAGTAIVAQRRFRRSRGFLAAGRSPNANKSAFGQTLCAVILVSFAAPFSLTTTASGATYSLTNLLDTLVTAPYGTYVSIGDAAVSGNRVAFKARYEGYLSFESIYTSTGGPRTQVVQTLSFARSDDHSYGRPPDGGRLSALGRPVIDGGPVYFDARVFYPDFRYGDGIFFGEGLLLQNAPLIVTAVSPRSLPQFQTYRIIADPLKSNGYLAYRKSSGENSALDTIQVRNPEKTATTMVVGVGTPAPLGGTFSSIDANYDLSGPTVAFRGVAGSQDGIYTGAGGPLTTIVKKGDPTPLGGAFGSVLDPTISGSTVAFLGTYAGGNGIFASDGVRVHDRQVRRRHAQRQGVHRLLHSDNRLQYGRLSGRLRRRRRHLYQARRRTEQGRRDRRSLVRQHRGQPHLQRPGARRYRQRQPGIHLWPGRRPLRRGHGDPGKGCPRSFRTCMAGRLFPIASALFGRRQPTFPVATSPGPGLKARHCKMSTAATPI